MSIKSLTLASALLISVSKLAITPVLSAECMFNCIEASPAYCTTNAGSTDRRCGPLRDNSHVERTAVEPNLESSAPMINPSPFRVSVDGVPADATAPVQQADVMRRADVAAPAIKATPHADVLSRTLVQADSLHSEPMLSVVASRPYVAPGDTVRFYNVSNYARYIENAEILVYRANDSRDAAPHVRIPVKLGETALWTPALGDDGNYRFTMRVYSKTGRYDETLVQTLRVTRAKEGSDKDERTGPLLENNRIVGNISVKGATVTVSGSDIPTGATVTLFGQNVPVSAEGKFVAEQIVPEGMDKITYVIKASDGTETKVERPVEIKRADHFLVAIGDVTAGHRSWNNEANVVELQGINADSRKNFVDGRFAFYYKGKLNDQYKVTASADTGEQALNHLFTQFNQKDPRSLLLRLDSTKHYPVYGDDSTTVEDAPTYGRFYVRVENPNSQLLWGNFQTSLTDNELTQYSRSLYGGKIDWRSAATTSHGERKTVVTGFAADPGTIGSRDEFASTGGTLYYLRHQDITQGSERVFVETRDRDSGLVLERRELIPAQDYDTNYLQGRILLRQLVPITAEASQFVRTSSFAGNPVYVVSTYEYSPGITAPSTFTLGGQGSQWLGDHLRIGGSAYHQGDDQSHQTLYGGDVLLRYKPGTYVRADLAKSKGAGEGTTQSASGGYEFNSVQAAGGNANALAFEAAADLSEFSSGRGHVGAYWRKREAGFSGPGVLTGGQDIQQTGATFDIALGAKTSLIGKADFTTSSLADNHAIEAGITHDFRGGFFAKAGVRNDKRSGSAGTQSLLLNEVGTRTDGAVTIGYRSNGHVPLRGTPASLVETERAGVTVAPVPKAGDATHSRPWSLYLTGQSSLVSDAGRSDNARYGGGGDIQLDQRTRVSAEVTDGNRGIGANIGANYAFSERGSLNLSYALAAESPDSFNTGRLGRVSATSRYRFTDAISVFGEGRYDHGTGPSGLTQAYGVDFAPSQSWRFGIRYEHGALSDAASGDIKRSVYGTTVDYTDPQWRWSSSMEHRNDDSSLTGNRATWATRNSVSYKPNEDWRLYGKINLAVSSSQNADASRANYYEAVAATAYRPIKNDRLNLLAKYTFLYDLSSPGQLSASGQSVNYAQRSHVFAIDATYQLNRYLAVGGKYAYRVGELRSTRDSNAQFFSSSAQFFAVRADVRVIKEWDGLAEFRRLSVREAKDARLGALVGIYRHLGKNLKVGVGYNFTNFSDDLTNLNYNEKGVFFNVIAKY